MNQDLAAEVLRGSCTRLETGARCIDFIFPENVYSTISEAIGLSQKPAYLQGVKTIGQLLA